VDLSFEGRRDPIILMWCGPDADSLIVDDRVAVQSDRVDPRRRSARVGVSGNWWWRGLRRILSVRAGLGTLALLGAAPASAAAVPYAVQVAGTSATAYWHPMLTLDGQTVTGFSMQAVPQQCTTTTPSQISNDESFDITLPAATPISGGQFTFQDQAPSSYGQHINGQDYVGSVTVTGVVTTTLGGQTSITGSVALAGASDPVNSGCSGSWTFTAIPKVTQPPWGVPTKRNFVGYSASAHQGLSVDYRSGVISDLVIEDNFTCAGQEDGAEIHAGDYGFADIHTSAGGSFRMRTLVLDEYGYIVGIDLTGRVNGQRASGRILISEPGTDYFQLGQAGKRCTGDRASPRGVLPVGRDPRSGRRRLPLLLRGDGPALHERRDRGRAHRRRPDQGRSVWPEHGVGIGTADPGGFPRGVRPGARCFARSCQSARIVDPRGVADAECGLHMASALGTSRHSAQLTTCNRR
jgi:hypothetical protein